MALRFFGQYLLETGAVEREQLLDAIEYQASITQPICALAIERGLLNKLQAAAIDEAYELSDGNLAGTALRVGLLTNQQVKELEAVNPEKWVCLGESLVTRGHVTLSRLCDLIDKYRREIPLDDGFLLNALVGVREAEIVGPIIQITVDMFLHYTKQIVQVLSVDVETTPAVEEDTVEYIFAQRIVGDKNFDYHMSLTEVLTRSIASHMMGTEVSEVNAMVLDAVSEFVNVVIGNVCTRLSVENLSVRAEPPRIMTREATEKIKSSDRIVVTLKTLMGRLDLTFLFTTEVGPSEVF